MEPKKIRCPFTGTEASLCQAIGEEQHFGPHGSRTVFYLLSTGTVIGILVAGRKINVKVNADFEVGDIVVVHKTYHDLRHNSYFVKYKDVDMGKPQELGTLPYERIEYGKGLLDRRVFAPREMRFNEHSIL